MKLNTIKVLQEAFNCNESVAEQLQNLLDPIVIARLIADRMQKTVEAQTVVVAKPAVEPSKPVPDEHQPSRVKQRKVTTEQTASGKGGKKISQMDLVRIALKNFPKGAPVTAADIVAATGITRKYANNYLWNLWKAGDLKSEEVGVYVTL